VSSQIDSAILGESTRSSPDGVPSATPVLGQPPRYAGNPETRAENTAKPARAERPAGVDDSECTACGVSGIAAICCQECGQFPMFGRATSEGIRADSQAASFPLAAPAAVRVRVVDLCCGLGGLSHAAKELGWEVRAGVDTNSRALRTFAHNFPEATAIQGCVSAAEAVSSCRQALGVPHNGSDKVVVLSGPPCQGFSAAGSRDPDDPRNAVLLSVAQAIAELQPHCAVIENVPPVLAGKHVSHVEAVHDVLAEAGFNTLRVLLDASEFGVCQVRRRAFFLVTRCELDEHAVLCAFAALRSSTPGAAAVLAGLPTPSVRPDEYDDEADCGGIPNHLAMRHSAAVIQKIAEIEPGSGPMSYRRLHPTRLSNTLFSGHRAPPAHHSEPRSITVREAARLQGFPDTFRVFGPFAYQMEQVTNAVPPPLARAVFRVLARYASLPVHCAAQAAKPSG
jgi:DNA (cytosine-5)-methyltransferase 1